MLLKRRHYDLFESYDKEKYQFKARTDLTEAEIEELLALDEWQMMTDRKHLITNYEEIKKLIHND